MSASWTRVPGDGGTSASERAVRASEDSATLNQPMRTYDAPLAGQPIGPSAYYPTTADYKSEKDYAYPSSYGGAGQWANDGGSPNSNNTYPPAQVAQQYHQHRQQPSHASDLSSRVEAAMHKGKEAAYGKRPSVKRNDSDSWERLLKGAGYSSESANASFVGLNGRHAGGPKLVHPSVRLLFYIIVPTALFWIPGIVALLIYDARPANDFKKPAVLEVGIFWWSVWLSSIWIGWWVCRVGAILVPRILRWTIGNVHQKLRRYCEFLVATEKFVAFFMWTILLVGLWFGIVIGNFQGADKSAIEQASLTPTNSTSTSSTTIVTQKNDSSWPSTSDFMLSGYRLWFGVCISAAILLAEKLVIQGIAYNFHRVSYEDRISTSKFNIKVLTTLYENSKNIQRKDTYIAAEHEAKRKATGLHVARQRLRKTREKVRDAALQSTSVLGTVASEIAGQGVSQPGNPRSVVAASLNSRKQTQALARRIWYSFCPPGKSEIIVDDIAHCFPDAVTAEVAFEIFDRDLNGDINKDELESACIEIHRERLALQHSMRDVDSAVGRLDSIFMSVYVLVSAIIIAAMLSIAFSTLVTSFGTLILGLSWLIGSTAQETLGAIIFLFIKHPYDVGDRVDVGDDQYIVKEMRLLTTVFKTTNGKNVMISHNQLATKPIVNLRRSGSIEESFKFEVAYGTSFAQIEALRTKMVHWLDGEKRDFLPGLDINVVDFQEQGSLLLSAGIRYKSNWQQGGLKAQRRNRWLCQLKVFLAECRIYGPKGDPKETSLNHVTMVPYPAPDSVNTFTSAEVGVQSTLGEGDRAYKFMDTGATFGGHDVFDEAGNDGSIAPGTAPPSRPMSPANALEQGRLRGRSRSPGGMPVSSSGPAPPYAMSRRGVGLSETYELKDQPRRI
ncbi:Mechanosensitive ion channel MscS [Kalmanozyma brasiliensis GHG001]|uniref:EF-hand domain-containing protein n=1 Tax=Kalmanozyma brasiliensis (strain GHG001) TaxID=1365824 RepID=V5EJB4_KALBG|nr:Mechanosensitive ion channel MscS [Kalmanozyma brasiliensis GHG001]EST04835.1 Mechanosensitive ion channel MscS [Kalmanozyma brasiliensis GHG001]